jgi:hypothetical protein
VARSWRERVVIYMEDVRTRHIPFKCTVTQSKILAAPTLRSNPMVRSNTHIRVPLKALMAVGLSSQTAQIFSSLVVPFRPSRPHRGCRALLARMWKLCRRQSPVLHVFGHIHASRGIENLFWNSAQSIWKKSPCATTVVGSTPCACHGPGECFAMATITV